MIIPLDPIARRIVGIMALVAVLALVMVIVTMCSTRDHNARQRAGETLADGRTKAAQDVGAIRDRSIKSEGKIQSTVETATDAIRQAPDDASRNRAALVGLCRIDPSSSPDCRMLIAHP